MDLFWRCVAVDTLFYRKRRDVLVYSVVLNMVFTLKMLVASVEASFPAKVQIRPGVLSFRDT